MVEVLLFGLLSWQLTSHISDDLLLETDQLVKVWFLLERIKVRFDLWSMGSSSLALDLLLMLLLQCIFLRLQLI